MSSSRAASQTQVNGGAAHAPPKSQMLKVMSVLRSEMVFSMKLTPVNTQGAVISVNCEGSARKAGLPSV